MSKVKRHHSQHLGFSIQTWNEAVTKLLEKCECNDTQGVSGQDH
jgi:hypothetical protein